MLELRDVDAYYGASQILFGVSMQVAQGEVVTLIGRNGMGKTTLIRSIIGLLPPSRTGRIEFAGRPVERWPSYRVARLGIGLVPEGRHVFPLLTVEENLLVTARDALRPHPEWTLQSVYELFPNLKERADRMATTLSGGEQQMLAIGRALMTNPRLLLLDEATEGLAPLVRAEIWSCVRTLKSAGLAILVVDRNLEALLEVADRHYVLEKGTVVWRGSSSDLQAQTSLVTTYLEV